MQKLLLLASAAAVAVEAKRERFRVGPTGIVSFAEGRAKARAQMQVKVSESDSDNELQQNAANLAKAPKTVNNAEAQNQPGTPNVPRLPASIANDPYLTDLVTASGTGTCSAYLAIVYDSGQCSTNNQPGNDDFLNKNQYPSCKSTMQESKLCTTDSCKSMICDYGWLDHYGPPYEHYSAYCNCGASSTTWIIIGICLGVGFFVIVGVVMCLMMRNPGGKAGSGGPAEMNNTYYTGGAQETWAEAEGEGQYTENADGTWAYNTDPNQQATY